MSKEEVELANLINRNDLANCLTSSTEMNDSTGTFQDTLVCLSHGALKFKTEEFNTLAISRDRILTDTRHDFLDKGNCIRGRMHTDTRDDVLDSLGHSPSLTVDQDRDFENLLPCGQLEAVRRDLKIRLGNHLQCSILMCSECLEDARMTSEDGEAFLNDLYRVLEHSSQGKSLCITKEAYEISSHTLSQAPDVDQHIHMVYLSSYLKWDAALIAKPYPSPPFSHA